MIPWTRGDGRPLWDDRLSPDERLVLDPGPGGLDATPDVLVIGGGIVGVAVAAMCMRRGIGRVCVVERDRLATGTSGRAHGELSPGTHLEEPPWWQELARSSLALHRELDAEWGYGLRNIDLVIAPGGLGAEAIDTLRSMGVEVVNGDEACSLEPELRRPPVAVVFRDQAHVEPQRLAAAFARHAGRVATGVEVLGVTERDGSVVRVQTSHGDIHPGSVVWCTGLPPTGAGELVKGHIIATGPAPFRLRCAVGSDVLVVQLPDDRLVIGGSLDREDQAPDVRAEVVSRLSETLGRLLPAADGLSVSEAWTCFRPANPDGFFTAEQIASNAWATHGHYRTGLLLAPAVGRAIASWVHTGARPAELG